MYGWILAWTNEDCLRDHQRFIDTYFSQLMENILLEMDVEETRMDTIGLQDVLMM